MERLSAAMMRPFRIIVGAHKPPVAGLHMSNSTPEEGGTPAQGCVQHFVFTSFEREGAQF
jgi:hypothetical protein